MIKEFWNRFLRFFKSPEIKKPSLSSTFSKGRIILICKNKKCKEGFWTFNINKKYCNKCEKKIKYKAKKKRPEDKYRNMILISLKRNALKRDDYQCKRCKKKNRLTIHHIKRQKQYPNLKYNLDNVIILCEDCHKKEHKSKRA